MVIEVMRFYGWNWEYITKVNLKLFWTLLGTMYRLQAQENLRWVQVLSMPNLTEDGRKEYIDQQLSRLGTVQISDERDSEGLNKLKNL